MLAWLDAGAGLKNARHIILQLMGWNFFAVSICHAEFDKSTR
jgi:hypothetical protein